MRKLRQSTCTLLCMIALAFLFSNGNAQVKLTDTEVTKRLAVLVTINAADETLGSVVQSLAKQTGVSIHAAPDLAPHRLALHMRSVTAITVLETVAETYGCRLERIDDGGIRILRAPVKMPADISGISAALVQALPPAYQRFLGLNTPLPVPFNSKAPLEVQRSKFARSLRTSLQKRVGDPDPLQNERIGAIWTQRSVQVVTGKDYSCAQWTDEERQKVLLSLFYLTIARSQYGLLQAGFVGLRGFELHPERSIMKYGFNRTGQPVELHIGIVSVDDHGGRFENTFGANLRFLQTPPLAGQNK